MSTSSPARAAIAQYSRSASGLSSSENLPPRTLARLAREVRDLHQQPPEGVRIVVDSDTGLPANLGELMVSACGAADEGRQSVAAPGRQPAEAAVTTACLARVCC